jgi:hypothetical protein
MFLDSAMDSAKAFWEMLIPTGLKGGALSHIASLDGEYAYFRSEYACSPKLLSDDDGDQNMDVGDEAGWNDELTQWWFDFLTEKGGKGVSKDTWSMVRNFRLHCGGLNLMQLRSSGSSFVLSTLDSRSTMWMVCSLTYNAYTLLTENPGNLAAWPSTIDEFVEYAKERRVKEGK